jgi:hypothetical protein
MRPLFTIALLLLLFSNVSYACEFKQVSFNSDYEQGGLARCEQLSEDEYLLHLSPENTPINPSPWYSFSVSSKTPRTLSVAIVADNARPRYLPKQSVNGNEWNDIAFAIVDGKMKITVQASPVPTMISAQPIIDNDDYIEWQQGLSAVANLSIIELGKSTQQRVIYGLVHQRPENKEWLLLIGRQHPPEVTGAQALLAFSKAIFDEHRNAEFFSRFNILLVPNVNPDGVALGYWRHNVNGVDLNRDWGKFTQAETQAVKSFIDKIVAANERIVFALDFHSTQQDIFYTMPSDYTVAPQLFSEEYLADLKPRLVSSFTLRERPGSAKGRGVFKQYLADEFNIHSITYEMGDNTPLHMINHVATEAAITLQTKMLATPADDFIYKAK